MNFLPLRVISWVSSLSSWRNLNFFYYFICEKIFTIFLVPRVCLIDSEFWLEKKKGQPHNFWIFISTLLSEVNKDARQSTNGNFALKLKIVGPFKSFKPNSLSLLFLNFPIKCNHFVVWISFSFTVMWKLVTVENLTECFSEFHCKICWRFQRLLNWVQLFQLKTWLFLCSLKY